MKRNKKLVAGIGTNDLAHDKTKQIEMELTPELQKDCYKAWKHRLEAQDCGRATVSTEWLTYSNFARWWLDTHVEGWSIDKDWIVAGNKQYHPDKCCWIPTKINNLMSDGSTNGLPKGVSMNRKSYRATCSVDGIQKYKNFKNPHDAHRQWQLWKIQHIGNVLCEFAFDLRLDGRVIQRMIEIRDSIQCDYDNNQKTI
ncbi:TPA: hypothetical protein ACXIGY_001092 [Serratia marcescens]